jgi:hypothetical protein
LLCTTGHTSTQLPRSALAYQKALFYFISSAGGNLGDQTIQFFNKYPETLLLTMNSNTYICPFLQMKVYPFYYALQTVSDQWRLTLSPKRVGTVMLCKGPAAGLVAGGAAPLA